MATVMSWFWKKYGDSHSALRPVKEGDLGNLGWWARLTGKTPTFEKCKMTYDERVGLYGKEISHVQIRRRRFGGVAYYEVTDEHDKRIDLTQKEILGEVEFDGIGQPFTVFLVWLPGEHPSEKS